MISVVSNLGLGPEVPIWPPNPGLLGPDWWFADRSTWQAEHWKEYARALEEAGYRLMKELGESRAEADGLREKLSRRKSGSEMAVYRSLLDFAAAHEPKRPGRKAGSSVYEPIAQKVLLLQREMSKQGSAKVTDVQAIGEWLRREGKGAWRAKEMRTVRNAMSKIRRQRSQK